MFQIPYYLKDLSIYMLDNPGIKLNKLLTGVDKIYFDDIYDVISNDIEIINGYGPTETTICSTSIFVDKYINKSKGLLPIGTSLDNEKSYVLDKNLNPVAIGVVEELYIGGAGLARGYLNLPELTAERFISNPFATKSDIANGYTRLYKTGDLVRWLPDGNIEYIGRNDFQVKIRGCRIELGEIESQLSKLSGIKQSVVLSQTNQESSSQYLVGYYVPEELNTLNQEELLSKLSEVLPDYMVLSLLVELIPLTINGKLDRKALPNPEFVNEDNYVAPISPLQTQLCSIWQEVLGLERVGIKDDFFR